MTKIRIMCDSACDLPQRELDRLDIALVSLSIRFGDEEFIDRITLTPAEFWRRCAQSRTLPETSAPSPGAFSIAYQKAAAEGCSGVVVIALSSLLSGTYQSALIAAQEVGELIDVRVVDSRAVSMAQGDRKSVV